jgi:uncharacterized protein (UPF0335 family)
MSNGPVAADQLRLLIERIERLQEEKKGIADDIKDVYSEAKSRGFCPKTMKRVVALRKLEPDERRELEAMLDLYKGALGMLDGTPLGTWAVEKLKKDHARKDDPAAPDCPGATDDKAGPEDQAAADASNGEHDAGEADAPELAPELTIEDARRLGAEAARTGIDVTRNPFPARDARRAAWDEAWCRELGSDGMDIPAALRPAARKPKTDTAGEDAAADAEADSTDQAEDAGDESGENESTIAESAPAALATATSTGADDEQYAAARAAVLEEQYASISRIQRRLSIGYNRAARIIEALEQAGVVSAADPTGKRAVLLNEDGSLKAGSEDGQNGAAGASGEPL